MTQHHTHASHPAIIKRLKRASGHLSSTIDMLLKGRTCLDIAQQLQAVEVGCATSKKRL
jgi:DNA-binding FrmR family transcriptional regulator